MTRVVVDLDRPSLRLTRSALTALAGAEPAPTSDLVDELVGAGVLLAPGIPTPDFAGVAGVVASPTVTGNLVTAQPGGVVGVDVWSGLGGFVLHAADDTAPTDVLSGPLGDLPRVLGLVVGLGPRPAVDHDDLSVDITAAIEACTGSGAPPWPSDLGSDEGAPPRLWTLSWRLAATRETSDTEEQMTSVLDLGPGGIWKPASRQGRSTTFTPTTTLEVFQRLVDMLVAARQLEATDDQPR